MIVLPRRVSETGEILPPSGLDPYEDTRWVQGAASTLTQRQRDKYEHKQNELSAARKAVKPKQKEDA